MFGNRIPRRGAMAAVLACVLLLGVSRIASAQRAHFGGRLGGNFDTKDPLLGMQASLPITRWLEVYPSVDYYFPDVGTRIGFNADLKLRFPEVSSLGFYTGGGFNLMYRDVGRFNDSDTDGGVNLLGGLETRLGWVHPFVEARLLWHDDTAFQLATGVNVTVGRRRSRGGRRPAARRR